MKADLFRVRDGIQTAAQGLDVLTFRDLIQGPYILRIENEGTTKIYVGNDEALAQSKGRECFWIHQLAEAIRIRTGLSGRSILEKTFHEAKAIVLALRTFPGAKILGAPQKKS